VRGVVAAARLRHPSFLRAGSRRTPKVLGMFVGRASTLRSDAIGSQAELRYSAIRKISHSAENRPSYVRVNRIGHPSRRLVVVARSWNRREVPPRAALVRDDNESQRHERSLVGPKCGPQSGRQLKPKPRVNDAAATEIENGDPVRKVLLPGRGGSRLLQLGLSGGAVGRGWLGRFGFWCGWRRGRLSSCR
jgi:hypothetical protein